MIKTNLPVLLIRNMVLFPNSEVRIEIDSDIDKKVTRVKVLIFNSENKILLCNVEGKYTFIGGHVEENETLTMALIRELREETGIVLDKQDFNSFIKSVINNAIASYLNYGWSEIIIPNPTNSYYDYLYYNLLCNKGYDLYGKEECKKYEKKIIK